MLTAIQVVETPHETPSVTVLEHDQVTPLRGPALRIAENMAASLSIPVATSQRVMPVRTLETGYAFRHPLLRGALKDLVDARVTVDVGGESAQAP